MSKYLVRGHDLVVHGDAPPGALGCTTEVDTVAEADHRQRVVDRASRDLNERSGFALAHSPVIRSAVIRGR